MCGFSGHFSINKNIKSDKSYRFHSLKHRGPDDYNVFQNDEFYCEFYRLNIIGGNAGIQPIVSKNKKYLMLFNGEIYNFKELSKEYLSLKKIYKSDTEVLLDLFTKYGLETLKKINGMFAIVLYDISLKKIYLIRDRFGTKPLYYSINNGVLYFSSEIKGISYPKKINKKVINNYLDLGYYPVKETFFSNINNLKPSSVLTFSKNTHKIIKYFDLKREVNSQNKFKNQKDYKEKFFYLLNNSIKIRQKANRKLNFHLSGGIDSISLLILTNKLWKKSYDLTTNTYFYKGFNNNENHISKKICSKLNIKNHQVEIKPNEIPKLAEDLQFYQDEPYGGLAAVAEYKQNLEQRKLGNIVSFEGIGGDELLGGYNSHLYLLIWHLYQNKGNDELLKKLVKFSGKKLSIVLKISKQFIKSGLNGNTDLSKIRDLKNSKKIIEKFNYYKFINYKEIMDGSLFRTLRFRDRSSAACGRELRFPFLDHNLLIHGLSMPLNLKFENGLSKSPLRSIVAEFDKNLSLQKKKSNNSAQTTWFRNELKDWVLDNINSLYNKNVIEKRYFKNLNKNFNPKNLNSFYLWQLVNLNLFFENTKKNLN